MKIKINIINIKLFYTFIVLRKINYYEKLLPPRTLLIINLQL
jgi:hypothetical protein